MNLFCFASKNWCNSLNKGFYFGHLTRSVEIAQNLMLWGLHSIISALFWSHTVSDATSACIWAHGWRTRESEKFQNAFTTIPDSRMSLPVLELKAPSLASVNPASASLGGTAPCRCDSIMDQGPLSQVHHQLSLGMVGSLCKLRMVGLASSGLRDSASNVSTSLVALFWMGQWRSQPGGEEEAPKKSKS